ncbi:hypothetical protein [Methanoculleus sp. 7T]|uniref:hypothetical protein n=1 Tax=Methanoculleus sp. 7T TaxID=2937282 RepID=UPI0020BEA25E|nr:hypothetical protein [Methanoculleus sp. 7T]MCK8518845.1 hypothetical protein [Methanoculleus sp. 7T]
MHRKVMARNADVSIGDTALGIPRKPGSPISVGFRLHSMSGGYRSEIRHQG